MEEPVELDNCYRMFGRWIVGTVTHVRQVHYDVFLAANCNAPTATLDRADGHLHFLNDGQTSLVYNIGINSHPGSFDARS